MPSDQPAHSSEHRARLRLEEYVALRATIRERGTRRVVLVVCALSGWAALASVLSLWPSSPLSTLVPLIVLVTGFEAAFALHVGVERIGRYLQVEYETGPDAPQWEHTAMQFGSVPTPAAGRVDPLFCTLFMAAAFLNLAPVALLTLGQWGHRGAAIEFGVFSAAHLAFLIRIVRARAYASRQRALDLAALARARN